MSHIDTLLLVGGVIDTLAIAAFLYVLFFME